MDIIIGAGVTGISYANFTTNNYLILEQESEIGGYCRTIKQDGFVWDYSGHFFHFRQPELEELVCRHIAPKTLRKVEKHTQILYKDQYIDFPFQKNIHQLEKEEFIDCLYDLFTAEKQEATSFKGMIYHNLGKSIAEKFLIPYNQKLYACDLDHLDADAMGRFFPKASREEIITNFRHSINHSYNQYFTYPTGGAIEYINSLYTNLQDPHLRTNTKVISIDPKKKTVTTNTGETLSYEHLISTMPLPHLLKLCGIEFNETVFTCNKVLTFNLGFDTKGKDTTNSWIYIPAPDVIFYRIGYYDNIIGSDRMSLYVEIGLPQDEKLKPQEYYLQRILKDLRKIGIMSESQQLTSYSYVVMDPAYVHINKPGVQETNRCKDILAQSNIYSIGRYGSWTYCSIEDNIIEARELAKKING